MKMYTANTVACGEQLLYKVVSAQFRQEAHLTAVVCADSMCSSTHALQQRVPKAEAAEDDKTRLDKLKKRRGKKMKYFSCASSCFQNICLYNSVDALQQTRLFVEQTKQSCLMQAAFKKKLFVCPLYTILNNFSEPNLNDSEDSNQRDNFE
jgi:hypothetical protein